MNEFIFENEPLRLQRMLAVQKLISAILLFVCVFAGLVIWDLTDQISLMRGAVHGQIAAAKFWQETADDRGADAARLLRNCSSK